MDIIRIKDLTVFANHGVFPEENVLGQKFLFSVNLYTSTYKAGKSDDLSQSINYGQVCNFISKFASQNTFKLLEKLCEELALSLLLEYPMLEKVDLEVKKPWAPIGLPLDYVSVKITRGWHRAYIALGSNMGNTQKNLDGAVKSLDSRKDCSVERVSSYIVTKPYGGIEQDDFLNGALELRTCLSPEDLLDVLHEIEKDFHRERLVHWGPRTLDLDIIFYDDIVLNLPKLQIPHVEMHKRDFVLKPLYEIAPWKLHPVIGKTVSEMLL